MKIAKIEVQLVGHYGNDETVVNAARVSFEKEASNYTVEQNNKLIVYLAKHKHFSPFNHAFLSFKIKAPIFVGRQLVKHKFMPWNEVSRRYVDSEPEFYVPADWRPKAENVKQGSGDDVMGDSVDHHCDAAYHSEQSLDLYNRFLKAGVCPEMARMVLPANMMTEWIWSGTLGAFADMLKLRLDPHSQKESRDVANLIYEEVFKLFPVSITPLLENK